MEYEFNTKRKTQGFYPSVKAYKHLDSMREISSTANEEKACS